VLRHRAGTFLLQHRPPGFFKWSPKVCPAVGKLNQADQQQQQKKEHYRKKWSPIQKKSVENENDANEIFFRQTVNDCEIRVGRRGDN
jgi:hypothetical protein